MWRKLGLALGVLLIAAVATVHALCGDVNGDGKVDIGDALLLAQCDVGIRSCDFGNATPCGPSTTTTTLPLYLPEFYATATPVTDGCDAGDTCVLINWFEVCNPLGPCPPNPSVMIERSPNGYDQWTTIVAHSDPTQPNTYFDRGLLPPPQTYYWHVHVLDGTI